MERPSVTFSYSLFHNLYLQQTPHFVILSHSTLKLNIYPLLLFQNLYNETINKHFFHRTNSLFILSFYQRILQINHTACTIICNVSMNFIQFTSIKNISYLVDCSVSIWDIPSHSQFNQFFRRFYLVKKSAYQIHIPCLSHCHPRCWQTANFWRNQRL